MGRRKKKASGSGPASLSLSQLTALLAQRQREAGELERRRDKLAAELSAVDAELQALTGSGRGPGVRKTRGPASADPGTRKKASRKQAGKKKAGGRGRSKSGETLADYILKALTAKGAPMTLTELREGVVSAGYPSKSDNLGIMISQRLPKLEGVRKVDRGVYGLAGGSGATAKRAGPTKKKSRKRSARK